MGLAKYTQKPSDRTSIGDKALFAEVEAKRKSPRDWTSMLDEDEAIGIKQFAAYSMETEGQVTRDTLKNARYFFDNVFEQAKVVKTEGGERLDELLWVLAYACNRIDSGVGFEMAELQQWVWEYKQLKLSG